MRGSIGLAAATAALAATAAVAQAPRPSTSDSFPLGSAGGVLCQVQSRTTDPAMTGVFDRAYAVVCRDAAQSVGEVYALRRGGDDPAARLAALRAPRLTCADGGSQAVAGLGAVAMQSCRLNDGGAPWRVYTYVAGKTVYVAQGLEGYDQALTLALRSIVADRVVPGKIAVATLSGRDAAGFARAQAATLDRDQALAEGYRRNNSGSYAEAAEFFDTLLRRQDRDGEGQGALGEYLVNRALQKSNLGQFAEADAIFAEADKLPTVDPVQLRLRRNFKVMHLVNQGQVDAALAALDAPVPPFAPTAGDLAEIDPAMAAALNASAPLSQRLAGSETRLTIQERAALLDAQALQLRGGALRMKGDLDGGERALRQGLAAMDAVRGGRVTSTRRLQAQSLGELSAIAEARGDFPAAEADLRRGVELLSVEYPGSAALNGAKARLAGYLARRGRRDASLALYKEVVAALGQADGAAGLERLLSPYFAQLIELAPSDPQAVADLFAASQAMMRPGVADTQAVLARELSGGGDEAARLFRQSLDLKRELEASLVELARLKSLPEPSAADRTVMGDLEARIAVLERDQAATQAALNAYPRYRAIDNQPLTLAQVQASLRPGEAYVKMTAVGDDLYAVYAAPGDAAAWKVGADRATLDRQVDALRDTISKEENGERITYPLDVKLARTLYVELFGPADARLAKVNHLIFEPDAAMLRLPANLLIADDASVQRYQARAAQPGSDGFDFTGVNWLGRSHDISTAVSARGFVAVRQAPASAARAQYLGFGENAPLSAAVQTVSVRGPAGGDPALDCSWPAAVWNHPISAEELRLAQRLVGADASVVTGAAFTDTGLIARPDIGDYRILHFATHGFVTAPRPECPARPALLTSFGQPGVSDGLLSFLEIYDLKLDADLVVLSACDTAGAASVAATREAGLTTGGGSALDGLVRAFIGAGARTVVASHWPAPDDYNATETLIGGIFEAPPGASLAGAMRATETRLMDRPETSHPYYWSGFAVIGDGAQPVLRR